MIFSASSLWVRLIWMTLALSVGVLMITPYGAHAASRDDAEAEERAQAANLLSDMQVRILKLVQLVAQLTGQVEELQFRNAGMDRQLQQLQDDLSLRVTAVEQALHGAEIAIPELAPQPAATSLMTSDLVAAPPGPVVDPNAPLSRPVAKQPETAPVVLSPTQSGSASSGSSGFVLHTDSSGKPLPPDPNQPAAPAPAQSASVPAAPKPTAAPPPAPVASASVGTDQADFAVELPGGTPKEQYDFAISLLIRQDYGRAEVALRDFVKKNSKDPLAANAQYWIGESLYARGDYQQAAMEFMNGYQNYGKSAKGPDNLLKLGMSLAAVNQVSGACTAFRSITKEFPNADDKVRRQAQAQRTKLKCPS